LSENAFQLVVLAGDGIGPEVTAEGLRVLEWFNARRGLSCAVREVPFGLAAFRAHGALLPPDERAGVLAADAVLFGAMGGEGYEAVPADVRRETGLLGLRRELDVFANLRPVRGYPALAAASPLKPEVAGQADLVVVRELTGGLYFGQPRGIETLADGSRRGVNTHVYTEAEIARIARAAFELARTRRSQVHSADKSNVMEAGALWREVVSEVGAEYPDVTLSHILADNCALQIVRAPAQFDVLLTDNMFGDLLSDAAAAIPGSLGLLPSASLGAPRADGRRPALYEPIHGAAPDIAGQGIANPLGAILSVAMMLRHSMDRDADGALLEAAVEAALEAGARTADIAPAGAAAVSTVEMGERVLAELERLSTAN
jgi:3-isopropylmalate dehydrogenase